jgi:tRNA nucleotidyltransferase (CCA-adding enzyme)
MERVLERITPTRPDRKKMLALAKDLEVKVAAECELLGVAAIVRLEGSLAKDTWLKEDPDVDVFIRLPPSIPRQPLGEVALTIAKKATQGSEQVERFAEHPYLEAFVDDVRVNIVPCYDVKPGEWLSATDRTPYHTDFINEHLKGEQRADVRLLKKYMQGIGVYGAEIKVGGFSGYLCELLVLHFGSFVNVLQAFSRHTSKRVIDINRYYQQRQRELELLFPEPLVIVDPVDKARNVASAVQPQCLHTFVAASRVFLKEPSEEFFYPLKTQSVSVEEMQEAIARRGSSLVFLTFDRIKAVSDVLWGQLYRTRKALKKQLEIHGFRVLRDAVWSEDNASFVMFILELEQRVLSRTVKHAGPPLEFEKECESFLSKYEANSDVVAGPFIDEGRWMVELPRKFTDAVELLRAMLTAGGRDIGVAELVAKVLQEGFLILLGDEVTEHFMYNVEFAQFLTEFLSGKPFWLETNSKPS